MCFLWLIVLKLCVSQKRGTRTVIRKFKLRHSDFRPSLGPQKMATIRYYLSSRFPMELISFLESYLKCFNAIRCVTLSSSPGSDPGSVSSSTEEIQIIICFPDEHEKMIQLIPSHHRRYGVSLVTPLWAISSIICKSLQPVVTTIFRSFPFICFFVC